MPGYRLEEENALPGFEKPLDELIQSKKTGSRYAGL
jgi:hypothetical protein